MRTNRFGGRTALIGSYRLVQCCPFGVGLSIMVPSMPRLSTLTWNRLLTHRTVDGAFKDDGLQPGQSPFVFCWRHSPSYEVAVFLRSFKENC